MTAPAPPAGVPVLLGDMLGARDWRVERQRAALEHFAQPVVSVTLVTPGPVKDTATTRFVMEVAEAELETLFRRAGWPVLHHERIRAVTGPEALCVIGAEARTLKRALTELEDSHPLGRLWDLDVIAPGAGSLSRKDLGFAPRRCLVCAEPGHACARSRRHPLEEVLAAIEERVNGYRAQRT